MGLRKGGLESVEKLITSGALGTVELSTGIQISGTFTEVKSHDGKPVYLKTTGQTALAYREKNWWGMGCGIMPKVSEARWEN